MSEHVGVAIIGCGGMGKIHARILSKRTEARVRWLCEVQQDAASALQTEVGADQITDDYRRALDDRATDLVIIALHHHLHLPVLRDAASAGKHIFVEKPLALTIEECNEAERLVNEKKLKLLVGFQARFSPFVLKLKEVIERPLVTIAHVIDPRWGDQSWANDPIEGGGNVLSQGCHCFDLVSFLNGSEPESIYAEGGNFTHPNIPAITDTIATSIRFASGSVANVTIGDFGAPSLLGKEAVQLFAGTKTATLWKYYSEQPAIKFWYADKNTKPTDFTLQDLPERQRNYHHAHGYVQQMEALIRWIRDDIEPEFAAKVRDGTRATALGVKAIESIRTRQPQKI